jgi:ABC-type polysaccharide/polyol phosphate export permease
MKFFRSAFADLSAAMSMRRLWFALASEDISDQHRRTSLGPVWLLINYILFAGTFIFIVGGPGSVPNYPAYVALGLFVWFYIMETINSGVVTFVREESFIKGTTLPLSIYIMRMTMHAVMRAAYAGVGCVVIVALSGAEPSWSWLMSLVALGLIVLVTPAAITIFAFLGAFFPDAQFIVQNLTRIGMFLTPVFWAYTGTHDRGIRAAFYYFNPFTYFLEIVRVPILSGDIPVRSFLLCITVSLVAWIVALLLLGSLRKRVAFVL